MFSPCLVLGLALAAALPEDSHENGTRSAAQRRCLSRSGEHEMSLSGAWEHRRVDDLSLPVPDDGWSAVQVPGYRNGYDYQRAWFRRSFDAPAAMRGKRIKIRFGGVKYNSRVYVNGKEVGGCFGGYRPFEVDVTDAVRFDEPNELLVGCHDWTGIFTPGKVDFTRDGEWNRIRNVPRDKILAPIGGLYGLYGIWDDVTLCAHPAVYVKDLFIQPSVRRNELVVAYTLANESPADAEVDLRAAVEDRGNDVLAIPAVRVGVAAGETAAVTLRRPWPDPHLWSHVDPYLYHLRSELSSGDVVRTRFGFREFWVDGHHYYLNGVRINLLATSWWPPHAPMTREEVRQRWEAVKQCGCVAFRTHTQPWRPVHYDVADEIGLLMIIEGAVWNDDYAYRIDDPVFWDNYAAHLQAMVDRDKNRPSVVMWSLENEFYGGRLNDDSPAKKDLVRMGRLMKQWDPTRPVFYESDGDPGGVADSIGIHYPHEYPEHTCWPNEAYWLTRPQKIGHMFHEGREEFFWDKTKPLYVGEFLWLPSSNPSWHTVFFGDDAYRDYRRYRNMGKGESWRMQILGYRHLEVAGISPWTVIEGGPLDETNFLYQAHQYAYQHVAAYCHDYDRRFYSGERVTRRVEVFNDVLEPSDLVLQWQLRRDEQVVGRGTEELSLGPADHRMLDVELAMPQVDRRTPLRWDLKLVREGKTAFTDEHAYDVFPRVAPPRTSAAVGLYDPKNTTSPLLETLQVPTRPVKSLTDLPDGCDVLVVGAGALEAEAGASPVIGHVRPERKSLADFAARGGRVLVLEQQAYPEGTFDVGLTSHDSTMTFPARPTHPALRGVERDDLMFWRGDHLVSAAELPRPSTGGFVPIVVSGSATGLDHAPLLEVAAGRGAVVHSQLKLVAKAASEPAAARILVNLLEYLASYRSRAPKNAVVGASDAYASYLRSIGLRFDRLPEGLGDVDLAQYSLLLCRGAVPEPARLRGYVEAGGNLVLHRVPDRAVREIARAFGLHLALQPYAGHVTRAEDDEPLLEAITREDLYWLGKHVGIGWAETPRAPDMADAVFTKPLDDRQVRTFEIEQWKLEGGIVEAREPGVTFATVGSATAEVDFPETASYVIGLVARGTPCDGVYPVARVSIDGRPLGDVSVAGDDWHRVTTFGRIEKGRRRVSVAFINDRSNPPHEDRNLYVDKVLIAEDREAGDVSFLTMPPAAAAVRRGEGTLVIDQLRWDVEPQNARKAARYAASLLTALGGDFTPRLGTTLECEQMTPQPGMPHFNVRGNHASLACTGYISTPIDVAASGRYSVEIVASGTPAAGVYPIVALRIDGKEVGQVELTGGAWRPYLLDVELTEGRHDLALAFTNDYNRDGEDRNLMLDQMTFYAE